MLEMSFGLMYLGLGQHRLQSDLNCRICFKVFAIEYTFALSLAFTAYDKPFSGHYHHILCAHSLSLSLPHMYSVWRSQPSICMAKQRPVIGYNRS